VTTTLKKIIASVGIAAAIAVPGGAVAVSMPLSSADDVTSACVASGRTVEYCDHGYLVDLSTLRVQEGMDRVSDGTPKAVESIASAHSIVNSLVGNPTKAGVLAEATVIKQLLVKEGQQPMPSDQNLVDYVMIAVHWYGPPGLEDTIRASANPGG